MTRLDGWLHVQREFKKRGHADQLIQRDFEDVLVQSYCTSVQKRLPELRIQETEGSYDSPSATASNVKAKRQNMRFLELLYQGASRQRTIDLVGRKHQRFRGRLLDPRATPSWPGYLT